MTQRSKLPDDDEADRVGYRQPPKTTRFVKGRSGNPAGRPRGRRREAPHEALLGQMVVVRENGIERHVTALEAFLLQLAKRGVEGSGPAARAYMTLMEEAKNWRGPESPVTCVLVGFGFVHSMGPLRMARTIDPYRETARLVLEPWLVEAALARLDRVLSPAEQRIVVEATRTPHKVKWPEWWSERPQTN